MAVRGSAAAAQLPGVLLRPDTAGQGLVAAAASRGAVAVAVRGDGPAADALRAVLARPHVVVVAPDTGLTLGRSVRVDRALVVIGGPVRVAATVDGDVVATGDLFLRPGANVRGRAVALGGGIYNSTLARVGGDRLSYRDVAAAASRGGDGLAVSVRGRSGPAPTRGGVPGAYGVRIPAYDRVNGLSVTAGPEFALDTGRVRVSPFATYRSQLGAVDVGLEVLAALPRGVAGELRVERGSFTNELWSRNPVVNSAVFAGSGGDAYNFYRADRAELTFIRAAEGAHGVLEPILGVRHERAFSAERDSTSSRPFTVLGRNDAREGARRPNPAVTGGRITSALAGLRLRRDTDAGTRGRAEVRVEQALDVERAGRFTRALIDVALERPLSGERSFVLLGHAAVVAGRDAPTQRYAYLGGGPTLPTRFLLDQGGNELVWAEGRYVFPLRVGRVPVVNTFPTVTLRAAAGAAGVNTLPPFTPNFGLRLSVGPLRADYVIDPRSQAARAGGRFQVFSLGVGLR